MGGGMSSTMLAVVGTIMVIAAAVVLLLATLKSGQEAREARKLIRRDIKEVHQEAASERQSVRNDMAAIQNAMTEGFERTDAQMRKGFTEFKEILNGWTDEAEAADPAPAPSRGSSREQAPPVAAKHEDE